METLLIALGAVALIPFALGLAILLTMWRAWWLHPLWSLVMVPLGFPQIGYWQFVASGMFLHAWFMSGNSRPDAKGETEKEKTARIVGAVFAVISWPILTFYMARWYLS